MRGYAPLTWDAPAGETSEQRIMRADVLGVLGVEGDDPEVIAGARRVAQQYMNDPRRSTPSSPTARCRSPRSTATRRSSIR